jgi:hypothetical protein
LSHRRVTLLVAALVIAPVTTVGAPLVDAVLADVEGQVVAASDVAMARALGLFGLSPSAEPIGSDDVERLVAAWLVVNEARRLGIGGSEAELEQAWSATARRLGGEAALNGWVELAGVERAWARAQVAADLARQRFVDLRFRAFVFVPADDVTAELGPGDHAPAARARARARLEEREVERRLSEWVTESERRVTVRRLLAPGEQVACPLPMPVRGAGGAAPGR